MTRLLYQQRLIGFSLNQLALLYPVVEWMSSGWVLLLLRRAPWIEVAQRSWFNFGLGFRYDKPLRMVEYLIKSLWKLLFLLAQIFNRLDQECFGLLCCWIVLLHIVCELILQWLDEFHQILMLFSQITNLLDILHNPSYLVTLHDGR
jgi:hypothetical protein